MRIFLLLISLLPIFSFAKENSDFIFQQKNGYACILHSVQTGETLELIAKVYSIKLSVLANVNNIGTTNQLKIAQPIIIPLLETNFYKTSGISSNTQGFHAVYYYSNNDDNLQTISSRFLLQPENLKKWNLLANGEIIGSGQKIIIGWVKLGNQLLDPKKNDTRKGILTPPISKPISLSTRTKVLSNDSNKSIPTKAVSSTSKLKPNPNSELKVSKTTKKDELVQQNQVVSNKPVKLNATPLVEKDKSQTRLSVFFSKIRDEFKPSSRQQIKNDLGNEKVKKENQKDDLVILKANSKPIEKKGINKSQKKKKSIKEVWSLIVNGKSKSNTQPTAKPLPQKVVSIKKTSQTPIKKEAVVKIENKVISSTTKPLTPKVSNTKTESNKISAIKKSDSISKPVNKIKVSNKEKIFKLNPSSSKKIVEIKAEEKKVNQEAKEIEAKPESKPAELNVDQTIRSEVKRLSLNNFKVGKCAYFFSGPGSGQFYAFTNLSLKGSIIKVTNVSNNKFVMVEVIGSLPNADLSKGLILKLSDNAKLPLGQKNTNFNIKVNY